VRPIPGCDIELLRVDYDPRMTLASFDPLAAFFRSQLSQDKEFGG
jgi:hypothetical protein